MPLVWQLADIIMALMAITNLTAILLLSPVVTHCQRLSAPAQAGRAAFDPHRYPDINHSLPRRWDDLPRNSAAISYRSIQGVFC
jgi:AGCS family alanine or glycine:cation symporter